MKFKVDLVLTGKLWAHEHFELSTPPDMVTFSKKFQTAGFFYHDPKIIQMMLPECSTLGLVILLECW